MARANRSDADKRLEELVRNLYGMKGIGERTKVGVFITLGLSGP